MIKIKVMLLDGRMVTLKGNQTTLNKIKQELTSSKPYVDEYLTTSGEVICDLDIATLRV